MAINEIFTWQRTYSVNIPLIDEQHIELVKLTNKLYRSCMKDREHSKEVFMGVLHGAVDYVKYHFATEEQIMERVNYPDIAAHKKEHGNFIREVLKSVDDFSSETAYNPLTFVKYLKDWVLTHIAVSDTAMGNYLVNLKRTGALENLTFKTKKVSDRYELE